MFTLYITASIATDKSPRINEEELFSQTEANLLIELPQGEWAMRSLDGPATLGKPGGAVLGK